MESPATSKFQLAHERKMDFGMSENFSELDLLASNSWIWIPTEILLMTFKDLWTCVTEKYIIFHAAVGTLQK